jgi:hypothetical protein
VISLRKLGKAFILKDKRRYLDPREENNIKAEGKVCAKACSAKRNYEHRVWKKPCGPPIERVRGCRDRQETSR